MPVHSPAPGPVPVHLRVPMPVPALLPTMASVLPSATGPLTMPAAMSRSPGPRTEVDRLSSAVRGLAIEAVQPPPFTQVVEDVPEDAPALVRRGRSAAKGKSKEITLTPVMDPVVGDTPEVSVAPPRAPPRRKRKQQL